MVINKPIPANKSESGKVSANGPNGYCKLPPPEREKYEVMLKNPVMHIPIMHKEKPLQRIIIE
jgi:hypothetical protein